MCYCEEQSNLQYYDIFFKQGRLVKQINIIYIMKTVIGENFSLIRLERHTTKGEFSLTIVAINLNRFIKGLDMRNKSAFS